MTLLKKKPFSAMALRYLALLLMLMDHSWYAIFKPAAPWMTCLGRLAMPIFAFQIAQGYFHTSNLKKYALRLLMFGVISEIPFNLFTAADFVNSGHQNVMFTLLLGLVALHLLMCTLEKNVYYRMAAVLAFAMIYIAADLLYLDYGGIGVTMVVMFGLTKDRKFEKLLQAVCLLLISIYTPGRTMQIGSVVFSIQIFAVFALIPIWLYNGKRGSKNKFLQYGAYLFYPAHLGGLAVLRRLFF